MLNEEPQNNFEIDHSLELSPRDVYDTIKHFLRVRELSGSEKTLTRKLFRDRVLGGATWLPASIIKEEFPGWRISVLRFAHEEGHEVMTGIYDNVNPETGCPDSMGIRLNPSLLNLIEVGRPDDPHRFFDRNDKSIDSVLDEFSEKPSTNE